MAAFQVCHRYQTPSLPRLGVICFAFARLCSSSLPFVTPLNEEEDAHLSGTRSQILVRLKIGYDLMLGLDGVEDGHARPMTAQIDGDRGPIWFFTSVENGIVGKLGQGDRAIAPFTSKGHDLFATIHGRVSIDRQVVEPLCCRLVRRREG